MKYISYIILFLISFNGVTQEFADKKYYLVDSLVLEELTKQDRELLDSCLKIYHTSKEDTTKIKALSDLIAPMMAEDWKKYQYYQYEQLQALLKNNPSVKLTKALQVHLANSLNNIGYIYKNKGQLKEALDYFSLSLKIQKEIVDKKGIADVYNNIGSIYDDQGQVKEALDYFSRSLKIREGIGDKEGIATSLNNIGSIYYDQGQVKEALDYFSHSLKIEEEIGDKEGIATALNNIGYIYENQGQVKEALDYFIRSLKILEEIGNKKGIAGSLHNIGTIYDDQGQLKEALDYFSRSLKIEKEIGNKKGIASSLKNIGSIYNAQDKLNKALVYSLKSLTISQEIGSPDDISQGSDLLSKIYEKQGKGVKALDMYKLHIIMRDSINNKETQKASAQQHAKYAYEKQKTIDDAKHDKLIAIEKEKKEKQQILTIAISLGLVLVVIFLLFVFNRLRITRKQKVIIQEQKEVVEIAHHELEEKNKEIIDSIIYAKRIQSAILPPAKLIKEYLKESFILYKPKDVVSGDFYWLEQKNSKVFFAAADCTGHGVPGAMVSVVCNNALNRSVREYGLTIPGEILDKTRDIVVQEFKKSEEDVKDGMDIALCSIEGMKLQYAGAYNPLWVIRSGELIEMKANKQPIGQFDNLKLFKTYSFDLEQGDAIYIFSDGYVDQFGGEKGKKFKSKVFRELLLSIQNKTMEEQNTSIDDAFEIWKGDLDQLDDVCVIGVRV